jgi:hypothetical protein
LQSACYLSHPGAPDAKHLREKLVRERELVSRHPIMRHEQPSGAALFHIMSAIAAHRLRELCEKRLGVKIQRFDKLTTPLYLLAQVAGLEYQRSTRHLPKRLACAPLRAQKHR